MDRERLDGWCENGILGLVLGILVFGPVALGAVEGWQLALIEVMLAGALALWVVRLWLAKKPQFLWPPVCWAMLAFVAYAAYRYHTADIEYVARGECIRILIYALLFLLVVNNLHGQEATKIIGLTVIFLGTAISMYAIWQFVTHSNRVWNMPGAYEGRGSGTFYYPNSLAAFLGILAPMALSYMVIGRLSHVMKVMLAYAALVLIAGIGVTLSRGGYVATAVTLVLFCFVLLTQRDYRLQGLALFGIMVAAGIFLAPKIEGIRGRWDQTFSQARPDDMRLAVWEQSLKMWEDHPWSGVGPAHFNYRFPQYRPAILQAQPGRVHNEYLTVLVDWGVVGAALVACVWGIFWWGVFGVSKTVGGPRDAFARTKSNKFAFLVGAGTGLIAIMLHSVVDFNLHIPAIAILVVTLMALLSSQLRFATERYWFGAKLWLKALATVVLAGGCAVLVYTGNRSARENYWLWKAVHAQQFSDARLAALKQAYAVEPMNPKTTYDIGEWYRNHSFFNMGGDPDVLAREALNWFQRGMALNPYDGFIWLRYGMCLDWLGPQPGAGAGERSESYFNRAEELDPNGYITADGVGWHYAQSGDMAAARSWFERSTRLMWESNDLAANYLPILERDLERGAARHEPKGSNAPPGVSGGQ